MDLKARPRYVYRDLEKCLYCTAMCPQRQVGSADMKRTSGRYSKHLICAAATCPIRRSWPRGASERCPCITSSDSSPSASPARAHKQLDKLRGDIPAELPGQILGTIWHDLGISDEAYIITHPAFVPARRVREVSVQNALQWTEQMKQLMQDLAENSKKAELTVTGLPGPSYTVRPRKRQLWRRKR